MTESNDEKKEQAAAEAEAVQTSTDAPASEQSAQPEPAEEAAAEQPTAEPAAKELREQAEEETAEAAEALADAPAESGPARTEESETAEAADADEADKADEADEADEADKAAEAAEPKKKTHTQPQADIGDELKQLVDLATKYPEVGPPLAQLAFKLGHRGIGDKLLRMGFEDEKRGIEFYFVAANVAREEDRYHDVLQAVVDGVQSFTSSPPSAPEAEAEEGARLLHLVRLGFAVLMFDLDDIRSVPEFPAVLVAELPKIEALFAEDAFYWTLIAQAQWFEAPEASEETWEKAVGLEDPESTWNSRGTWYKEAEKDLAKAETAYRKGLQAVGTSALLRHNLAQVLMDRAQQEEAEPEQIRHWLVEAEGLLKNALRQAQRGRLRYHIRGNLNRLGEIRDELPALAELPPPSEGDVLKGRVVSLAPYGAFVALGGEHRGLLHNSEIAHEYVKDPADFVKVGEQVEVKVTKIEDRKDGNGLRISLSRKALTPAPEGAEGADARGGGKGGRKSSGGGRKSSRGGRRNSRGGRGGRKSSRGGRKGGRGGQRSSKSGGGNANKGGDSGGFTLGEMLMAKLEEKKSEKDEKKDS